MTSKNNILSSGKYAKWSFSSGNWGCGVFGGDRQLKFMIQWLACSIVNRKLNYCYSTDNDKFKDLALLIDHLKKKKINEILEIFLEFVEKKNANSLNNQSLFNYLLVK